MKTEWDYSDRAHTYDSRADYSITAVTKLLAEVTADTDLPYADVGAGTGKLTKLLLNSGLTVKAIEPNDNMRSYGIKNTLKENVEWSEGIGEATGLADKSVKAAFFGSSFNVVDQIKTLEEVKRILCDGGTFACMWNHRDTEDTLQADIEKIIHKNIPGYNYGLRRQNPSDIIEASGFFEPVKHIDERFHDKQSKEQIIAAWKSHDTLYRQAGERFDIIIEQIDNLLEDDFYSVPYHTRIWCARLKS